MPSDRMRGSPDNRVYRRSMAVYLSKILLICRTRNTYGYNNSMCMRILQLFLDGIRRDKKVRHIPHRGLKRRNNPLPATR